MKYRRGWIAVFLFSLGLINYMDRIALSLAARPIAQEFKLNSIGMGYLFSSYIWTYALVLIPVGFLIDRIGTRRTAAWAVFIWSGATVFTGLATNLVSLMASRLVMGAAESASNPLGTKVIRQWIPASERGSATALFNCGAYAGPAVCSVLLASLVALYGWRTSFVIAGGIGFIWVLAWLAFFDLPEKVKWLDAGERSKILDERDKGGNSAVASGERGLLMMLRSPTLWGIALVQGLIAYTQFLLLSWLPSYFQATQHVGIITTGIFSAIPYVAGIVCCIVAGRLSDVYLKSRRVSGGQRRNAVAIGLLMATTILAMPFLHSVAAILLDLSIAVAGTSCATSLNYALLNDLMPSGKNVAKATSFMVLGGNVFGFASPIITGYVIAATGSYNWAFGIAGILLALGIVITLAMTRGPIAREGNEPVPHFAA